MNSDDLTTKNYLETVSNQCNGDIEQQVSMYEAGAVIGLEKNEAGALAEDLMVQGLLELKTLAGDVSITTEGLGVLGLTPQPSAQQDSEQRLGDQQILDESDLALTQLLIEETKTIVSSQQLEFTFMQEIVFDLKTIEVQLMSPSPKTAIVREVLSSIQNTLTNAKLPQVAERIASSLS